MPIELTIPSPGESITEVVLGPWLKPTGELVDKDEVGGEIEAAADLATEQETVRIGEIAEQHHVPVDAADDTPKRAVRDPVHGG